jgi:hypothetical protein
VKSVHGRCSKPGKVAGTNSQSSQALSPSLNNASKPTMRRNSRNNPELMKISLVTTLPWR